MQKRNDHQLDEAGPEILLLINCAKTATAQAAHGDFREFLDADIDWEKLIALAIRHGMVPILYHSLRTSGVGAIPSEALLNLGNVFRRNAHQNLLLTGELRRILQLFAENGIPAAPFKGPVLAMTLYRDVGLRQFIDLDILVPKGEIPRTIDLLVRHGYQRALQLNPWQERAHLAAVHHTELFRDDKMVYVEIHDELSRSQLTSSLDAEWAWPRLRKQDLFGMSVLTFDPEDLLLVLCIHHTKHLWERLSWLGDVAQLIGRPEIDWDLLLRTATATRSRRLLFLGLVLADDLLGASAPDHVMEMARADAAVRRLAKQACRVLFSDVYPGYSELQRHLFHLNAMERTHDKLLYLCRSCLIPTPAEWERLPLPRALFPAYYLIRPARLLVKHSFRLLSRAH